MYTISDFKEKDDQVILDFMKQHSFAMLVGCSGDTPVATQVPILFTEKEGQLFLRGHIMRNTDHHKAFVKNTNVLCVFTGAHTYVSARLYADPHTASTWNYMTVHTRGKINFLEEDALISILNETTSLYENDPASPASFTNLPKEYVSKLAKAIVAFKIEVTSIENVFKLSQNKDQPTYRRIINDLEEGDNNSKIIAKEMRIREEQLFEE